jgi:Fe-S-cluster containining protein
MDRVTRTPTPRGPDMPKRPRLLRQDIPPGDCLCDHCTGKCCRYFSLPIETPTTWDDYDSIRWYLAHGQTVVYVDKGIWYLLVMTKCQYLDARNRCGIYHDRPKICRDYTTDDCEYDEDWTFTKVFESPEQIWEYAEAVLPPRRRPRAKAKAGAGADGILWQLGPAPR